MKNICTKFHLFESSFWGKLDEIRYSEHWQSRTWGTGAPSGERTEARVQPHSKNFPYGFRIQGMTPADGSLVTLEQMIELTGSTEQEIYGLVTNALISLCRNEFLRTWDPEGDSKEIFLWLLKLGRISLYWNNMDYIVTLEAGAGPSNLEEFYPAGDAIWGYADKREANSTFAKEPFVYPLLARTIKFYPNTPEGNEIAYQSARKVSGQSQLDFYKVTRQAQPYGNDFVLRIDMTDDDNQNRITKIKAQVLGQNIELGPRQRVERGDVDEEIGQITRKTIKPGDEIGLIPSPRFQAPIMGTIDSILNMNQIKSLSDLKDLPSLEFVEVQFNATNEADRITVNDRVIPFKPKIKKGTRLIIDGNLYEIPEDKSIVTSEPSIIKKGHVQLWVRRRA